MLFGPNRLVRAALQRRYSAGLPAAALQQQQQQQLLLLLLQLLQRVWQMHQTPFKLGSISAAKLHEGSLLARGAPHCPRQGPPRSSWGPLLAAIQWLPPARRSKGGPRKNRKKLLVREGAPGGPEGV
ncbi:hypothetical protein Emed_003186 [Eimeria media]